MAWRAAGKLIAAGASARSLVLRSYLSAAGYWRSRPPYCDVTAVQEAGDAGGERWHLTKVHAQFEQKAAAHARLVGQQRQLLDGLVPCLQLLLTGAACRGGGADGSLPPAKAARTSCSVQ